MNYAEGDQSTDQAHWSSDATGYADSFATVGFDPDLQTGGDWYAMLLTASLGGRPVHGATFAPTMEVLCKQPEEFARNHAVGRIRYDATVKQVRAAGDAWDELPLAGEPYRPVKTSTNSALLFDSAVWEPSSRSRAKAVAFLAAQTHAAGNTLADSVEIAKAIAGEEVPEDAVLNATVPLNFHKREAAGVAKPSHALFSRGNAQKAIKWEDQTLGPGLVPPGGAIDWGRLTTIARYIGEANVRIDPRFTDYAASHGVPFGVVTGCWATVAPADYAFDPGAFKNVPRAAAKGLPTRSLAAAYTGHHLDIHAAIMRAINSYSAGQGQPDLAEYIAMAEAVRKRADRSTFSTGSEVLAGLTRHQYQAEGAAAAVADSATADMACRNAFMELVNSTRRGEKAAADVIAANFRTVGVEAATATLVSIWAGPAMWERAVDLLAMQLGNPATARTRVARHRRATTETSTALGVPVGVTARTRGAMERAVQAALRRTAIPRAPVIKAPVAYGAFLERGGYAGRKAILDGAAHHLKSYREAWADRYEAKARWLGKASQPEAKWDAVMYGTASVAFRNLTGPLLMLPDTGYIDPAIPGASYLAHAARGFARKRLLAPPHLAARGVASAADIAWELDKQYKPKLPFAEVEEFCRARIKMLADDIVGGAGPTIPGEADIPADEPPKPAPYVPPPRAAAPAPSADMMAMLFAPRAAVVVTPGTLLVSYDTPAQAEAHAKANGYVNFAAAVKALGAGARFDVESKYTEVGLAAANVNTVPELAGDDDIALA